MISIETSFFARIYNFDLPDISDIRLDLTFENVFVQGFRSGLLIAEDTFDMADVSKYSFDSVFSNLDTLTITALDWSASSFDDTMKSLMEEYPGYTVEIYCAEAPCAHFNIDNVSLNPVTLNPVPLPASLPLFTSVIGLFGVIRYKIKATV